MTRIKNSPFEGVRTVDADVDAPTFERVFEDAAGDTANVYDQLTGKNGEADTMIHDGNGRGALLGIPWCNTHIGAAINIDGGGNAKDGGGGATYLIAMPLFIPEGEDSIVVDILSDFDFATPGLNPVCYCRAVSNFAIVGTDDRVPFAEDGFVNGESGVDGIFYRARITGLAGAGLVLFFVECDTIALVLGGVSFRLHSISIHPGRQRGRFQRGALPFRSPDENAIGVTAPASTIALHHVDFDYDYLDDDNDSLNGYLLAFLNRNQNGLMEYLTGWPAGGNATYTQEDQTAGVADDVNPGVSRFFAHTRANADLAAEPEVDFPLWAEPFGAFKVGGGLVTNAPALDTEPTSGMLQWFAPWPSDSAQTLIRRLLLMFPDFQTSSSRLKWAVLIGSDVAAQIVNWRVVVDAGGSPSSTTTPVVVTNSPNGGGSEKLWIATGSALAFLADENQVVSIITARGSGSQTTVDECVVLGACLYFEP